MRLWKTLLVISLSINIIVITTATYISLQQSQVLRQLDELSVRQQDLTQVQDNQAESVTALKSKDEPYDEIPHQYLYAIHDNTLWKVKDFVYEGGEISGTREITPQIIEQNISQKIGIPLPENKGIMVAEPRAVPFVYFGLARDEQTIFQYNLETKQFQKMPWSIDIRDFDLEGSTHGVFNKLSNEHVLYVTPDLTNVNDKNQEIRSLVVTDFFNGTQIRTTPLNNTFTYTAGGKGLLDLDGIPRIEASYDHSMGLYGIKVFMATPLTSMFDRRFPIQEQIILPSDFY